MMKTLAIVIPCYNEEKVLHETAERIGKILEDLIQTQKIASNSFIYFVDDGSKDKTWEMISQLNSSRPHFKGHKLSRNVGHQRALISGLLTVKDKVDMAISIDADLQDDPFAIKEMIEKMQEGYDLVSGWKQQRKDPISKTLPSKLFNLVTQLFTGITIHDFNCGLKVYRKEITRRLELRGDMHRYIPVLAEWMGFKIAELPVRHQARQFGTTKYDSSRFFSGLFDFLSVLFITRYLRRPMHFFGMAGLISFILGFTISLYVTLDKILLHKPVSNRPILFLGILLLILGVQLFSTGLLGEMLSTSSSKGSSFAVRETVNLTPQQAGTFGNPD